ncbi:GDSL-type esterase/lipase family protein [Blastopirellula sp. J2-11]|uniref:SGNH/GDSL hydrolase family protein n=1 Tax=Blastopirellula sp. J2-11 TaxID=2943192 RepID=UPI0021C6E1D5|nr:GDSL-type esterase/lipase family protein [Blastopirellula sp. J2-11]UUO07818.1 GDSL-type esterase/lipase family protein [Blastopirellula sp. J2-11]
MTATNPIIGRCVAVSLVAFSLFAATPLLAEESAANPLSKVQQRLADGELTKIVCFGDSITGVYYHSGSKRAWCDMLGIALKIAYPNADLQMINAGRSGHTTVNALARIDRDVIAKQPQLVIVSFGMNDVARVPLEDYQRNMREIIRRCQDGGAKVIVCTPNAVSETEARPEAKLAQYVDAARSIAAGFKLPLVDLFDQWRRIRTEDPLGWSLLMSDEIHPNMTGHLRFAELIGSTISGRPIAFVETPAPLGTLQVTSDRLARKETIKLIAAPPYDTIVPEELKRLYPEAKFDLVVWPAKEQTIAAAAQWAKQIRGLKPHLVIPPLPPQAFAASQDEFIREYQWVLNYSLPQSGGAWDVVPILPLESPNETARQKKYLGLASRIIAGKDLLFIGRSPGETRSANEIVGDWFAGQKQIP